MQAWVLRVRNYHRLKYTEFHRDDYKVWVEECNQTEAQFYAAFKGELNPKTNKPFSNFLQINHHTHAFHWVSTIFFNGPATLQSTQSWEHFHQPVKSLASNSNGKNIFLSVMQGVCLIPLFITIFLISY